MEKWKEHTFSDFLVRNKTPINIDNSRFYKRVTIRTKHGGVSVRDTVIGSQIGTKKQFILSKGQFVLSKIDARYGAFGVALEEVDGAIITGNFWAYDFNKEIITIEWLEYFTNSPSFYDICERASSGITHRKYLNEVNFLNNVICLPSLEKQKEIVAHFKSIETEDGALKTELTHQQTLLKKLRQQILQEAIEGKLTADWRAQHSPPLEGWQAKPDGVVHSPPLEGCPKGGVVHSRNTKNYLKLPFNSELKQKAKELRKAGNLSEVLFWNQVKHKQFQGLDFDRQKIIGNYIVDFYCANFQVVIEIDGSSHDGKQDYDRQRDAYLEGLGLTVIHVLDADIKNNLDGVMRWLCEHEAFQPPRQASPATPPEEEPPRPSGTPPEEEPPRPSGTPPEEEPPRPSGIHPKEEPPRPSGTPPKEGNWESASELLARIQAEKERLVKEGKIKKQKPLPPISEDEKPFALPEGWAWCRVNDIASIGTGATPLTSEPSYYGGEINWMTSGDTSYDYVTHTKATITEKAITETNCQVYPRGTLVVAMYGQGKTRGQVTELKIDAATNQACVAIQLYLLSIEANQFLKTHFKKIYNEIRELAQGGPQPNLNMGKIKANIIALPPLLEQKAIVAKVEKLLALCDQLETQITTNQTHADGLMQAVLKEAFSHNSAAEPAAPAPKATAAAEFSR